MGIRKVFVVLLYSLFYFTSVFAGQFKYKGVILQSNIGLADGEIYPTYIEGETDINPFLWDFIVDGEGSICIGEGDWFDPFLPRFQKFSNAGDLLYTKYLFPPHFKFRGIPVYVTADRNSNLYLRLGYERKKDMKEHPMIFKFSPVGKLIKSFFDNPALHSEDWLILNSKGQLLLLEYTYVYIFDTTGTLIKKNKKTTKYPAANGEYFFDLTERGIEIFNSKGVMVKIVRPEGNYALPRLIDENNNMYGVYNKKSETGNLKIVTVHDHNGNLIAEFNITGPGNRLIKEDGTLGDTITVYYKKLKLDPYGNIYFRGDSKDKAYFLKFAKPHCVPVELSKMPGKKILKDVYNVSEYTYVPEAKIKETGFRLFKDGEEISKYKTKKNVPLSNIKYLGKDNLRQHWVYYEIPRTKKEGKKYIIDGDKKDWIIMKREKSISSKEYYWRLVLASEHVKASKITINDIITEDKIDFDKVRISTNGDLCYKSTESWYKQKYIGNMFFVKTDVKDFIKPDENITAKAYTEYDEIDPVEMERGIEIKKGNESIRKLKYYYQDTLYTVENLGLDDKNNIYVYVNWFDWLTKDKMKEVVKFNTKGEFQNRISLTVNETPVLGQDGFVYTYEQGEKGIIRKYEPVTLPEGKEETKEGE